MFKKERTVKKKPATFWGKLWYFIWYEDSVASWVVNIILAFIIIKYILYPGIGLAVGTDLPIVAVVSESMEHDGSFDEWWQSEARCDNEDCTQQEWYNNYNINKNDFDDFPFSNGFQKGDIMFLTGVEADEVEVGDVIVYLSGKEYPIIHRAIRVWNEGNITYFETKGDHNQNQIIDKRLNEQMVSEEKLMGRAVFRIPWLGYIKIGFVDLLTRTGAADVANGS
ncbi:MAG: signal peptidase I [archaeon]